MKLRLTLQLLLSLISFVIIFIVLTYSFNRVNQNSSELYQDRVIPMGQLKIINDTFAVNIIDAFNKHLLGDFTHNQMNQSIDSGLQNVESVWREYMSTYLTPEESAIASRFAEQQRVVNQYLATIKQQPVTDAMVLELYQKVDILSAIGAELTHIQESIAKTLYEQSLADASSASKLVMYIIFICVVATLYLNYLIFKYIEQHVGGEPNEISEKIKIISQGDFTLQMKGDEQGIYRDVLNLADNLKTSFRQSASIADNVASASEELATVMIQANDNANIELEQIENVSSAVNQLTVAANEVSIQAERAQAITLSVAENVTHGGQSLLTSNRLNDQIQHSVDDSVNIVGQLNEFTNEINDVIEVINSISDQTNLLALNAAIEAARAGEQGRGFAVVADEVRALAVKTQQSTLSIREIINKLQAQSQLAVEHMEGNASLVEESKQLSSSLANAFDDIKQSVEAMNDVNNLVASATQEQVQVTNSISENVTVTLDTINQNVAGIAQTTSASEELSHLSAEQNKQLARFKIDQA
ncbi:methyl-accepting chemotaxis protein [Photobacterium makurazakiensis]|uniref:methyl-accepting chemotaxis protein n=1 Tax=Photobacterium makurazakiensis TaxID=2910234 RepID=UPI003D13163B